jgi:hypothetical protein
MPIAVIHCTETSLASILGPEFTTHEFYDLPTLAGSIPSTSNFIAAYKPSGFLLVVHTNINNGGWGCEILNAFVDERAGKHTHNMEVAFWLEHNQLDAHPFVLAKKLAHLLFLSPQVNRLDIDIAIVDETNRLTLLGHHPAMRNWTWADISDLHSLTEIPNQGLNPIDYSPDVFNFFTLNNDFNQSAIPPTSPSPNPPLALNTTPFALEQLPEAISVMGLDRPEVTIHSIFVGNVAQARDSIIQLEFYLQQWVEKRLQHQEVATNIYLVCNNELEVQILSPQLERSSTMIELRQYGWTGHVIAVVLANHPF